MAFLSGQLPRTRAELRGDWVRKAPFNAHRTPTALTEEVHVLVIGESVRRDSWSAYGYRRPTTPYLDALRAEAVFFENAMADANLTSYALQIMLTGQRPEEAAPQPARENLLDPAREAGYQTAWLVNQDIRISTAIGIAADRLEFPPDLQSDIFGRHVRDEVLLPAFRREISRSGAARFIGMHTMGSHWEYQRRFPPAFQRFGRQGRLNAISMFVSAHEAAVDVLDAYDNSLLYTDWFLHEVIEQVRALDVPATVTYFPDHGEELEALDGNAGHGQPAFALREYQIPAFVWMNARYREAHPEIAAALRRNASKNVRTRNVFYSLGQIMGIDWPRASPSRSFASDQFRPDDGPFIAGGVLVTRR